MRNYFGWSILFSLVWWLLLLPKKQDILDILTFIPQRVVLPWMRSFFGEISFFEDSSGMYLLLVVAVVFGMFSGWIGFIPVIRRKSWNPIQIAKKIMLYFLVLELWEYGWIKLIKLQFYLPEPNTVYTELGNLSKDIAYWSVIGSSPVYVIFMGVTELLAGILLVFTRTRFVGLLLSLGIFINVFMVNLSFDISVKLFSGILLVMTLLLLVSYRNQLRVLFQLPVHPEKKNRLRHSSLAKWAKSLVLSLLIMETIYPTVVYGIWNDDTTPRPVFHGAYSVDGSGEWKRLFVHRQGYLILENTSDKRFSYTINFIDGNRIEFTDEQSGRKGWLKWQKSMKADLYWNNHIFRLELYQLPYRDLPLFVNSIHCFSDEYH